MKQLIRSLALVCSVMLLAHGIMMVHGVEDVGHGLTGGGAVLMMLGGLLIGLRS